MTTQQSFAGSVRAAIRGMIESPDWAWRHEAPRTNPAQDAARRRLKDEMSRACRWLEHASAEIGMPLPAGNGTNGPWQRIAVVDSERRFGLLDIAHGRIAWTDAVAPSYVRRFAVASHRGTSPHLAGGSGGAGSAVAQIALAYGLHGMPRPRIIPPRPRIIKVEYGMATCYGYASSLDDSSPPWAALIGSVPHVETEQQQRVELCHSQINGVGSSRVDPLLWERYARMQPPGALRGTSLRDGHMIRGGVRDKHVWVTGSRPERERVTDHVRNTWPAFARAAALDAAREVLDRCGIGSGIYDHHVGSERVRALQALAHSLAP